MIRGALEANTLVLRSCQSIHHGAYQSRLADASLTCQQYHLTFTRGRLAPTIEQQRQLLVASNEGSQLFALPSGKPCFEQSFAMNRKDLDRFGNAFEILRTEWVQIKQLSKQLPGVIADYDCIIFGQRLQSRREIRRLAHSQVFLVIRIAHFANHHRSGVNANAHGQLNTVFRLQAGIE